MCQVTALELPPLACHVDMPASKPSLNVFDSAQHAGLSPLGVLAQAPVVSPVGITHMSLVQSLLSSQSMDPTQQSGFLSWKHTPSLSTLTKLVQLWSSHGLAPSTAQVPTPSPHVTPMSAHSVSILTSSR